MIGQYFLPGSQEDNTLNYYNINIDSHSAEVLQASVAVLSSLLISLPCVENEAELSLTTRSSPCQAAGTVHLLPLPNHSAITASTDSLWYSLSFTPVTLTLLTRRQTWTWTCVCVEFCILGFYFVSYCCYYYLYLCCYSIFASIFIIFTYLYLLFAQCLQYIYYIHIHM